MYPLLSPPSGSHRIDCNHSIEQEAAKKRFHLEQVKADKKRRIQERKARLAVLRRRLKEREKKYMDQMHQDEDEARRVGHRD